MAALMVFFSHFVPFSPTGNWRFLHHFFQEMYLGVGLFFTLSGFLIAHVYFDEKIQIGTYLARRFVRIFPIYWLITFLFFLKKTAVQPGQSELLYRIFLNASLLKGFFSSYYFDGLVQAWSLTVELCFYLLAPALFWLIREWLNSIQTHRTLFYMISAPAFFFILFWAKSLFQVGELCTHCAEQYFFVYTFGGRWPEFLFGVALAIFAKKNSVSVRKSYRYTLLGLAGIFLGLLWMAKTSMHCQTLLTEKGIFICQILIPLLGFLPLIYGLCHEENLITKLFSSPPLVYAGKISYAFYLVHIGVVYEIIRQYTSSPVLIFLSLIVASVLAYEWVEKPLSNWVHRRFIVK